MSARVTFTAVADHGGNFGSSTKDETLVFNKNITNIGGGYNNTTGVFKAPIAGDYYFTFSYQARKDNKSGLSLMKNGKIIVKGADTTGKGEYLTENGGNSAVLELALGDEVSVCLPANHYVWASDNTTSFSGFLLRR